MYNISTMKETSSFPQWKCMTLNLNWMKNRPIRRILTQNVAISADIQLNHQNCFINKLLIILKDLWLHFNCWKCFRMFFFSSFFEFFFLHFALGCFLVRIKLSNNNNTQNIERNFVFCDVEMCEATKMPWRYLKQIDKVFLAQEFSQIFLIFINQMSWERERNGIETVESNSYA